MDELQVTPSEEWQGLRTAILGTSIRDEYLHRGAASVLAMFPDIATAIRGCISDVDTVLCMKRKNRQAIDPEHLNDELRSALNERDDRFVFEAEIAPGGIVLPQPFDATRKTGFDAVLCDMPANVARLWNRCFGKVHLHRGAAYWEQTLSRYASLRHVYEVIEHDKPRIGTDWYLPPRLPTILVEIEFANTARRERDFFKAIAAASEVDVDLFVFISTSKRSNRWISSGTVHHGLVQDLLESMPHAVPVPTWALGLEISQIGALIRPLTPEEELRHAKNARNPD